MRPEVAHACAPWRLARPVHAPAGRFGDRMGRGLGSSLEFSEYREYVPGDDVRHVDWRACGRTDALFVRRYREEVSPHLDVVLDRSASMASTPEKDLAARDLLDAFAHLAQRSGSSARRFVAGGDLFEEDAVPAAAGPDPGTLTPRAPMRPRGVRVVIGDFLVPDDPAPRVRALAAGAAQLLVVQLLDPWEADPALDGAATLVDVESEDRLDLTLTPAALDGYRRRLGRLRDDVARAARGAGAGYALVLAADLGAMLREALAPQGVVEPA